MQFVKVQRTGIVVDKGKQKGHSPRHRIVAKDNNTLDWARSGDS
jgi:hypothetical protein